MFWKVFYDDGSTYHGSPELAPSLGVILIVESDEEIGRFMLSGYDYYWWDQDCWRGGDIFGLWDYLHRPGWKRVLFGRTIHSDDFKRIYDVALKDGDFPPKSAKRRDERR